MARKSLGHVHLEWTCPNCDTKNPGLNKTCLSCGMPQPEGVKFEQGADTSFIKDEKALEKADKTADVHCFYCGTRNPADAEKCTQCGGDLTEAKARAAGEVIGAHKTGPVADINCPSCGTTNPGTAAKCTNCGASLKQPKKSSPATANLTAERKSSKSKGGKSSGFPIMIGIAMLFIAVLACCAYLNFSTEDVAGRVEGVTWQRTINVEELRPVSYEDWDDEIPSNAVIGTCTQEIRRTQDQPAPNATEVCGTPYTIDEGTGLGEVVQDCQYQVYDNMCNYTVEEWQNVPSEAISLSGNDFNPLWPTNFTLDRDQREADHSEEYTVRFSSDGESYTYTTSDFNTFRQFEIGSEWTLSVNKLGGVVDFEPQ